MEYCHSLTHQYKGMLVKGALIEGMLVNEAHNKWYHLRSSKDFTREIKEGRHSLLVHELSLFIVFFLCPSSFFLCVFKFHLLHLKEKNHHCCLAPIIN
jgi:hypothetical protein